MVYPDPKNKTTTHFVALLEVQKVERIADRNVADGQRNRTLDEVTKIVVKAPTLAALKDRLRNHIGLIADFTDELPTDNAPDFD